MREMNAYLLHEIAKFGASPSNQTLNDKSFNAAGYETAIRRATRDLTPRTLTPKTTATGTLIDKLLDANNPDSFLNQIQEYFAAAAMDDKKFDKWHHERCNEVLTEIQQYYTNKNGSAVCYGKAQKIVNMTLKGCYCLQGARDREAHFEHCHMALDSFTLAWYNRNTSKSKTVTTPWSNLDETEYKNIQYNFGEDSIRKINLDIDPFKDLTPLQKEFLIWPLEIMINTVKEVNKCFGGMVDAPYVKDYFTQNKMENDLIMANIILDRDSPAQLEKDFVEWLKHGIRKNQTGKIAAAEFVLAKYGIE